MDIAFIGLGNMGAPMARNLLAAGHKLTVYNRTRTRAEPLQSLGAKVAATPREAAAAAPVLITMLSDDHAVEEVMFAPGNALDALRPGAVHISMSTISVALSRRLAETSLVHDRFLAALAQNLTEADWSVIAQIAFQNAGLAGPGE